MPDRSAVEDVIPPEFSSQIITGITNKSAARQLLRRVDMKQREKYLPIISLLPDGGDYLDDDDSLKPISEMAWTNKILTAVPIATIVYFPEDVVDDLRSGANVDAWEQARPLIEDDLARKLDNAIFFGINKPSVWPDDITTAAIAAGNTVDLGTGVDPFDDVNTAMSAVEADGFDVNGFWANQTFKGTIRNARDGNNGFLYPPSGPANTGAANTAVQGELFGEKLAFSKAGLSGFSGSGQPVIIAADWSQFILGVRTDLRWKMLDEATLYDGALSTPLVALAQQDSVAIRVVGRFAFQVANPPNRMNENDATRYPAAVVVNP